jgi:hypothetical protein
MTSITKGTKISFKIWTVFHYKKNIFTFYSIIAFSKALSRVNPQYRELPRSGSGKVGILLVLAQAI